MIEIKYNFHKDGRVRKVSARGLGAQCVAETAGLERALGTALEADRNRVVTDEINDRTEVLHETHG